MSSRDSEISAVALPQQGQRPGDCRRSCTWIVVRTSTSPVDSTRRRASSTTRCAAYVSRAGTGGPAHLPLHDRPLPPRRARRRERLGLLLCRHDRDHLHREA